MHWGIELQWNANLIIEAPSTVQKFVGVLEYTFMALQLISLAAAAAVSYTQNAWFKDAYNI